AAIPVADSSGSREPPPLARDLVTMLNDRFAPEQLREVCPVLRQQRILSKQDLRQLLPNDIVAFGLPAVYRNALIEMAGHEVEGYTPGEGECEGEGGTGSQSSS